MVLGGRMLRRGLVLAFGILLVAVVPEVVAAPRFTGEDLGIERGTHLSAANKLGRKVERQRHRAIVNTKLPPRTEQRNVDKAKGRAAMHHIQHIAVAIFGKHADRRLGCAIFAHQ